MFIDNVLFKNPLGENIIDIKIDRNISDLTDVSEEDNIFLIIKRFSEIEEETEWIWKPYIPLGCLVALIGETGVGKSTISAMIAGKLSSGGVFPCDTSTTFNSYLPNRRDNPATTTKKRLIAASANLDKKGTTIEFLIKNGCFELVRLVSNTENKQKPIDKAVRFIEAFMSDEKSVKASEIRISAQNEKISLDTLLKAKQKLNLQSVQRYEENKNIWYWEYVNPPVQASIVEEDENCHFEKDPFGY